MHPNMIDPADYTEQFLFECEQRELELGLRDLFDRQDADTSTFALVACHHHGVGVAAFVMRRLAYAEERGELLDNVRY